MKRYTLLLCAALSLGLSAAAQNINPTVQVTNTYEGKLMEVHKQELEMAVPDSLLSFDWQFDYSTFDRPYKGAYDFNPYLIDMKPEAASTAQNSLYFRAGAGYSLHPEAQLVWSPSLGEKWALSVYDDFAGYWGDYVLYKDALGSGDHIMTPYDNERGHDVSNRLGVSAKAMLPKAVFTVGAGFDLLRASHAVISNSAEAGDLSLGIKSQQTRHWEYEASASYRGLSLLDECHYASDPINASYQDDYDAYESTLSLGGGAYHHHGSHLTFGLSSGYQRVSADTSAVSLLTFTPQMRLEGGKLNLRAGLLFSVPWRHGCGSRVYRGNICYPQIYADWMLVPDRLKLYLDFTGGETIGSYDALLQTNHFAFPRWHQGEDYFSILGLYDSEKRSFDISGGVKGRFGARVQYQATVGAYRLKNMLAESISEYYFLRLPVLSHTRADMTLTYVDLKAAWNSSSVTADGEFRYQGATRLSDESFLTPSHLTGHLNATYNWNGRIYFGAGARFASKRTQVARGLGVYSYDSTDASYTLTVPGYWDLGVDAEFKVNRKFSVWAHGGNLLGQPVYDSALIVRKDAYFTLGLTLDL